MAVLPSLRYLLNNICRASARPATAISSLFHNFHFSILTSTKLPLLFSATPKFNPISKTLTKPHLTPRENSTLVLTKDERLGPSDVSRKEVAASSGTIAAIVTSLGGPPGAVGIVRLSGPSAVAIVGRVFRTAAKKKKKRKTSDWQPTSHVVEYGVVSDRQGNVIDEVLVIPMLAPRSYTREDVVELQCHGSEVCLRRVLRACLEAGARLAEPGQSLFLLV
ncbi:hypothetical protein U1Q18_037598 [Sarracenia purpurea var. burkii]